MKKIVILILAALAIFAFVYFDVGQTLTLENLKSQQHAIDAHYRASPLIVIVVFFLVYVAATAASFPGAAILTLAAGAIFGVVTGTLIVSFASTVGATMSFLASRYLFRDWVQARLGNRLWPRGIRH